MSRARHALPWLLAASALWTSLCALQGCRLRRDEPALDAGAPDAGLDSAPEEAGDGSDAADDAGGGGAAAEPPPEVPEGAAVVAFGGIGSQPSQSAAVLAAVRVSVAVLAEHHDPLRASVRGAAQLEDEPAFNAGTGSSLRADGMSVQMDAAVMDSRGRFAAIGAVERVRNPVFVAQALLGTPHVLLVGDGATAFARSLELPDFDPLTDAAIERRALALTAAGTLDGGPLDAAVEDAAPSDAAAADEDAGDGGPAPPASVRDAGTAADDAGTVQGDAGAADTIAVLVRGADGALAGAVSSGGPDLAPRGRVGDVVVPGAALFVGAKGAVAITGHGESLYRLGLAQKVYEQMMATRSPKLAVQWALAQVPRGEALGVAALDRRGSFVGATVPMAWAEATPRGERTAEAEVTP